VLPPGPNGSPLEQARFWLDQPLDLLQRSAEVFGDIFTLRIGSFLGGASFGGLVAQQLWSAGKEVPLLALFNTPGPDPYTPKPTLSTLFGYLANVHRFGWTYVREMGLRLGRRIRSRLKGGHRRASGESKILQGGAARLVPGGR
jgi:hypothetical protein